MELIILHGESDSGKSHSLNILYYILLYKGYIQVPGHFKYPDPIDFIGERVYGNIDFSDILTHDEKKIGITTGGEDDLASVLEEFKKNGCIVAVCAISNSVKKMTPIAKMYPKATIVEKTSLNDRALKRINDTHFAMRILALI